MLYGVELKKNFTLLFFEKGKHQVINAHKLNPNINQIQLNQTHPLTKKGSRGVTVTK